VGLKYFARFFSSPYVFRLLKNTFLLGIFNLLFSFPLPIIFALLLDQLYIKKYKKVVQTISYMPHFISVVVVVGVIKELFAYTGSVNDVIEVFGGERITFLVNNEWFRPLYIGSGIWQGLGWGSIIYLAALTNVDPQLIEASIVDGANRFQRVWHISLPAILPTISIMLIFAISGIMGNNFQKILLLYNSSIYEVADVINTYVYREGIMGGQYEYTTAIGLLMNLVGLFLISAANYASRKLSGYSFW
jgi:putative aldouronate transport system permease protein